MMLDVKNSITTSKVNFAAAHCRKKVEALFVLYTISLVKEAQFLSNRSGESKHSVCHNSFFLL